LEPGKLQEALLQVFPGKRSYLGADPEEVPVVDGKHLRSGKEKSPHVRLVEDLALHLQTTLAQARAEGR
jgi:hypothetical protein